MKFPTSIYLTLDLEKKSAKWLWVPALWVTLGCVRTWTAHSCTSLPKNNNNQPCRKTFSGRKKCFRNGENRYKSQLKGGLFQGCSEWGMLSWCLPKVDRLVSRLKAFSSRKKITRYRAVANRCCELRSISAPKRHLPWRPKGWTKEAKTFQTLVSH